MLLAHLTRILIFDPDRMRGDGWRDEVVEDSFDRFEGSVAGRRSWD
jgi:hypothetical protein